MKTWASLTRVAGLVHLVVLSLASVALAQNETNHSAAAPAKATSSTIPFISPDEARPVLTLPRDISSKTPDFQTLRMAENGRLAVEDRLSPSTAEIVKLAQARIDDDVIVSFIENSGTFSLGADEIIYLTDVGVSREVIRAMLQHDYELTSGLKQPTISSTPQ